MTRGRGEHRRDERGLVLPTRLMVFSISAVALAGLAFVATQPDDTPDTATPAAATRRTPSPAAPTSTVPVAPTGPAAKPKPAVRRGKVYVVVFNNSNVHGLAGKTATRAQRAGWNVVGTDNWYGTIDATTVYYPPRLKAAGTLLARDLGISRVKPAIAPMRPDRLTVILTGTFH
ncbi:MAG TPA: LytR C-terminal domain-containing protein [Marmoricola sp.]|nr:LytR C-terminal domain-containing protein [Marmoricola sp.]